MYTIWRMAQARTNFDACYALATRWDGDCLWEHHTSCPRATTGCLYMSVMHVGTIIKSLMIHLPYISSSSVEQVALNCCTVVGEEQYEK